MSRTLLAASIVLSLSLSGTAHAVFFPTIGSGTIYARYDGEHVNTSGPDVTNWLNQQSSSYQATLNATAHTGFSGAIAPGLPNLLSNPLEINGYPYLRFTRTSNVVGDALRTGVLSAGDQSPNTDKFTIFHVGRLNAIAGSDPEWYDGVNSVSRKAFIIANPGGQPFLFTSAVASAPDADGSPVDGEFHIWATVWNGSSSEIWMDGIAEATGLNPGTQSPWAGISIAARHTDSGGTAFFNNGDYAELVAIRGALNTTEFNLIGSYLEFKYGLDTAFADMTFTNLPEPSSLSLLGLGAIGMAIKARRRRRLAART